MRIEYINRQTVAGYLECVKDLNREGVALSDLGDAVISLDTRSNNIITLVGLEGDEVVATATVIMEKKLRYDQYCCHIEDVAVREDQRGKGYGAEIVRNCVDRALDIGCYKIKLNCADDLVGFYEELGFAKQDNHMVILQDGLE